MKLFVGILAIGLTANAFALNEVECTGKVDGQNVKISVEQNFSGDRWNEVDAELKVGEAVTTYKVRGSQFGFHTYSYYGEGFDLRVDFWPDNGPRWGSFYDGTFIGAAFNNTRIRNFRCRFPSL